jgi:hypothetical protein
MGDRKRERGRERARMSEEMLTSLAPPYMRLSMFVVSVLLNVRHYLYSIDVYLFTYNIHM